MTLTAVQARIAAAAARAGRDPAGVTLVAVSKRQPAHRVEAVLTEGHRVFGENYVQEAQAKWPDWRRAHPGVQVHLIGPLQTNKARIAVGLFDAIHTLDRPSLARKLAALAAEGLTLPPLLVQVNTGAEAQKAGIDPGGLAGFLRDCASLGLSPAGLMAIPPEAEDPTPHFALLARLGADHGLPLLSMGMSVDVETAIAHGATHVRVGSAIFGARPSG